MRYLSLSTYLRWLLDEYQISSYPLVLRQELIWMNLEVGGETFSPSQHQLEISRSRRSLTKLSDDFACACPLPTNPRALLQAVIRGQCADDRLSLLVVDDTMFSCHDATPIVATTAAAQVAL